jgi:hypothetical protein
MARAANGAVKAARGARAGAETIEDRAASSGQTVSPASIRERIHPVAARQVDPELLKKLGAAVDGGSSR